MRPSFYDLQEFPALEALAKNWKIIRDEYRQLNAPILPIDRVGKLHEQVYEEIIEHIAQGGEYGWLQGWTMDGNPSKDWIQYGLIIFDETTPFVQEKMPRTVEMLLQIKGIKTCAISKLKAVGVLPVHQHPEIHDEGLLQMHLTLDAPEGKNCAYLNVEDEFVKHRNGEMIIFDGSLDHFAFNASTTDRAILYMEFDKALLSKTKSQ